MPNTQGMTTGGSGLSFTGTSSNAPFVPSVRSVFTELEQEELKQMMREVLEEYGLKPIDQL